jgi:hypothetical protein
MRMIAVAPAGFPEPVGPDQAPVLGPPQARSLTGPVVQGILKISGDDHMATETVDTSSMLPLGKGLAETVFGLEEEGDSEMALGASQEIPEREVWLYNNADARETVLSALGRLREGLFCDSPPDVDADQPWLEQLED